MEDILGDSLKRKPLVKIEKSPISRASRLEAFTKAVQDSPGVPISEKEARLILGSSLYSDIFIN